MAKKILTHIVVLLSFSILFSQSPSHWTPSGIGGGGGLFAPSFSPHNSDEFFIACDMGGLYRSVDMGENWDVLNFREIRGGVSSCVRFTNIPSLLYCLGNNGNGFTPKKSTDGGEVWTDLPADPTGGDAWFMTADQTNTQRIIVTDYSDLWFSGDGGNSFDASKYHSSSAGGLHVAGVFFDGTNIFVGTNTGLLVSTDGGNSFTMNSLSGIPSGQGILSFAGAKEGSVTRFYAITAEESDIYAGISGGDYWGICTGVYSMDAGTGNWVQKTGGLNLSHDFVFFVSMSFDEVSTAYLAGGNSDGVPVVFKTTNGGISWSEVFLTDNNQNIVTGYCGYQGDFGWYWAECALGFAVSPVNSDLVMITDFGFAHMTSDGGVNWRQVYVNPNIQNPAGSPTPKGRSYFSNGLENTSSWWMTWSDSDNIFASYTDIKGVKSSDGGNSWSFDYTGHNQNTMYQALKHINGYLYAATSTVHDIYQSTYLQDSRIDNGSGMILFSVDTGSSWNVLHDFGHPVIWLAFDPNNQNRLYASVIHSTQGGIFVSNDIQNGGGSSWSKLADPPRTEGHPFCVTVLEDNTILCSYSGRRDNSGAFTASSGVFVSTNGGNSWLDRSDDGMYYWTKDLVVYPHDNTQNTWYACVFSGWGGPPNGLGGLYRTTDRGLNWSRICDLDRVESCTFSTTDPDFCYLATEEDGLWYSQNITSANPDFIQVTSYPFAHPVRVFFNPFNENEVWITSFGNGIKKGYVTTAVEELPGEDYQRDLFRVYPNPCSEKMYFTFGGRGLSPWHIEVFDISGRSVGCFVGVETESLDLSSFSRGVYMIKAVCGTKEYRTKILLIE